MTASRFPLALGLLALLVAFGSSPVDPELQAGARGWVDGDILTRLNPEQQSLLLRSLSAPPGLRPVFCWVEGSDPDIVAAFDPRSGLSGTAFELVNRWTTTATNGSGLAGNSPITLTWGIAPDGTRNEDGSRPGTSRLISAFDNQFGAGPGGDDLTQRPWFPFFSRVFDRWAELIGVRYVYEPNDDGADFAVSPGVLGVRPDVRISGYSVDGTQGSNIFGFNYFPNVGDMVLDLDNIGFMGLATNEHRALRNLVAHEHGHGLGIAHTCPEDGSKLMEPTIRTNFDGPQLDDQLSGHVNYGDWLEHPVRNDLPSTATLLDPVPGDTLEVPLLSLDGALDADYFRISLAPTMKLTVRVVPVGETYLVAPQDAACSSGFPFDAGSNNDPTLQILREDGATLVVSGPTLPAGNEEFVEAFPFPDGGTYYIAVTLARAVDQPQIYTLQVFVDPGAPPSAQCRDVGSCSPNVSALRVNQGSNDPDGDPLEFRLEPPAPFPPGETPVLFIATDGFWADTCSATITVNASPSARCDTLFVVDADTTGGCGPVAVTAQMLDSGSMDPDGDEVVLSLDPPGPYAVGSTPVNFIATDACGSADTCATTVTVRCATPVRVVAFTAARTEGGARLRWEITDVVDHAGFEVYREGPSGERVRLGGALIVSAPVDGFLDPAPPREGGRYWLLEVGRTGARTWHGPAVLPPLVGGAVLARPAPNPFRATTRIAFSLAEPGAIRVVIFDARGARVRRLWDGPRDAGTHVLTWDGRTDDGSLAATGLYFVRLDTPLEHRVRKVLRIP